MALSDITGRAAPLAQSLMEDDEVKRRLRAASSAGAGAVRAALGKSKEPTRASALQRAGTALREAGKALSELGSDTEKRRKQQKRKSRSIGPAAVLAGGLAAAAAVLSLRSDDHQTPKEDTHG